MLSGNDYSNLMTVDVVDKGDCLIIYLIGECDIGTLPLLTRELRRALAENKHVVLEVHLLTYIDSTGISVIASTQESLTGSRRSLRVVGAHGLMDRIMHLTKLDQMIPLDSNLDEALAAISVG